MKKTRQRRRTKAEMEEEREIEETLSKDWQKQTDEILQALSGVELVRINFLWHYQRLRLVKEVAKKAGVPWQTFIKVTVFMRSLAILADGAGQKPQFERQVSRLHKRADLEEANFRWQNDKVEMVKRAAALIDTDYRTLIEDCAYRAAKEIHDKSEKTGEPKAPSGFFEKVAETVSQGTIES